MKKHALVETLMSGEPITSFMGPDIDQKLKLQLSRMCCDHLLDMVFLNNFVHGDLHPGNILVKYKPGVSFFTIQHNQDTPHSLELVD